MPGIGIGLNRRKRGSSYWVTQNDELLFFAETKNIADGKLYNQMNGSTDFLTVAGSPNTFQCPNTAPYIAADTDFIWFKTDESQRTVTTAELIGYDLQRTPIKYGNVSPNAIDWIAIVKAGVVLTATPINKLHSSFDLSVWWSGVLNLNGVTKDNRAGQQLWTPEFIWTPASLSNCQLYLRADKDVTVTGSGISEIKDQSANNNHAVQADNDFRPALSANSLNGLPAIAPTAGKFLVLTSAIASLTNYTISFVTYFTHGANNTILSTPTSGDDYISVYDKTFLRLRLSASNRNISMDNLANGWHIFTISRNYSGDYTNQLRIDLANSGSDNNSSMGGKYTGLLKTNVLLSTQKLCEVVVYADAKSADDIALVENYFKNKYGL